MKCMLIESKAFSIKTAKYEKGLKCSNPKLKKLNKAKNLPYFT